MNEKEFSYNLDNPVIRLGEMYGVLQGDKGRTKIHNRVYEQRIYNYMASKMETSGEFAFGDQGGRFLKKLPRETSGPPRKNF